MSYFAKPFFIAYDEWFDDDLENNEVEFQNKTRKYIYNVHDFFYLQSKTKIGASENHSQLEFQEKSKNIFSNSYDKDLTENYFLPNKEKYEFFKKASKSKTKLNSSYKFIYSLTFMSIVLFLSSIIFLNYHSRDNKSNAMNQNLEILKYY